MTDPARVLIIEDDATTAREMSAFLSAEGFAPEVCVALHDGLDRAAAHSFDAIVLDRMLPGGDGIDAIATLRTTCPGARVLVVSALGRAANRIEGLDRGADDYLPKPFEPGELSARIRALLRRNEAVDTDLLAFGALQIRIKARTVHAGDEHIPLSPREFDLLVFFAQNTGDLVTRMQLLEHVWNLHFDPQTNVVDVHVSRLRRKLEAALPHPVLHTSRGLGYIFDPNATPQDA
jgi:two-component system OmpR family response regulator